MSDKDLLYIVYGAMKAREQTRDEFKPIIEQVEAHLFPPPTAFERQIADMANAAFQPPRGERAP